MFNNITDPDTFQKYPICSPEGKNILNQYINNYNSAGQKGGASALPSVLPPTLPSVLPSITITTPPTNGPQKSYLETFFNSKTPPICTDAQMKELKILINSINRKIIEKGRATSIESEISRFKKHKETLKKNPDNSVVESIARTLNASSGIIALHAEFRSALASLNDAKRRIESKTADIQGLEYRINDKRGLESTERDSEQLARWRHDLHKSDTTNEIDNIKLVKEKLISALVKSLDYEIAKRNKQKKIKLIYIASGNHKCVNPNQTTLEIRNLDLKYGHSATDRGAVPLTIEISAGPRDSYTLEATINAAREFPIFATPMTIIIPRSIFILDLSNLQASNEDSFVLVKNAFNNSSNTDYFKRFAEYILSFADNLTKGSIDNTLLIATQPGPNFKIIGLLDETYLIDNNQKKQNILVKVNNFQIFKDPDSAPDIITIDLQMAVIPSYDLSKFTITPGHDISIADYAHTHPKYKLYGKLNFLNEQTKIVDDNILGLATPAWCPLF